MHVLLADERSDRFLLEELRRVFPAARSEASGPGVVISDFVLQAEAPPVLVFARQLLPEARECRAVSVTAWAERLFAEVVERVPADQPWRLHVTPRYGHGTGGQNRCRLIREGFTEMLRRKRRQLLRGAQTEPTPFAPADTLVQAILTSPEQGWLSVAAAPRPYQLRRAIVPFPGGEIPGASDKSAPSRAFAKLVEAEVRLGRRIAAGETCVDLGASPGSWSYVALQRGARVIAVDRAPLRADLMRSPRLRFEKGDAFRFEPDAPVEWLLCDVIAAPERSIGLVLDWVRQQWARHFVVSIKFKGETEYPMLERLRQALPPLCEEFFLTRLCANKNEACVFGTLKLNSLSPPR